MVAIARNLFVVDLIDHAGIECSDSDVLVIYGVHYALDHSHAPVSGIRYYLDSADFVCWYV